MVNKKVLIIDDDNRNIFALKAVLASRKFDCVTALSAAEGIELIKSENDIDIVLIDMMMPDMDGYEAIPIMKNLKILNGKPIIAVTAQAMVGDEQRCIAAGADGYVSKPVDVDKLLDLIKKLQAK